MRRNPPQLQPAGDGAAPASRRRHARCRRAAPPGGTNLPPLAAAATLAEPGMSTTATRGPASPQVHAACSRPAVRHLPSRRSRFAGSPLQQRPQIPQPTRHRSAGSSPETRQPRSRLQTSAMAQMNVLVADIGEACTDRVPAAQEECRRSRRRCRLPAACVDARSLIRLSHLPPSPAQAAPTAGCKCGSWTSTCGPRAWWWSRRVAGGARPPPAPGPAPHALTAAA